MSNCLLSFWQKETDQSHSLNQHARSPSLILLANNQVVPSHIQLVPNQVKKQFVISDQVNNDKMKLASRWVAGTAWRSAQ
jgi:hypothetical protein